MIKQVPMGRRSLTPSLMNTCARIPQHRWAKTNYKLARPQETLQHPRSSKTTGAHRSRHSEMLLPKMVMKRRRQEASVGTHATCSAC